MLLLDFNEDGISIVGMQFGRSQRATDARALRGKTSGSALPGLSLALPRFPWHADYLLVSASVLLFCGLRSISVFTCRDALGAFFVVACCFGGGLF